MKDDKVDRQPGLFPVICSWCGCRIPDEFRDVRSHGICPQCLARERRNLARLRERRFKA